MKTNTIYSNFIAVLLFLIIQMLIPHWLIAQKTDCTQCGNHSNTGEFSTTLGQYTTSADFAAFASGFEVYSTNAFSFAHGKFINVSGTNSVVFGSFANASNQHNMVLGHGVNNTNRLENNIGYTLMAGFNSDLPTLFIGKSIGAGYTGKIGIGNVTAPQAKLHIRADENFDC
jgi:hypothetical protein